MSPIERRRFLTQLSGTFASVALAGCGGGKAAAPAAAGTTVPPQTVPGPVSVPAPGPVTAPAPAPIVTPAGVLNREQYEDFTKLRGGYVSIDEATLAGLRQTPYPVGVPDEMTYDEPGTGYRDEIGIRARASQLWAMSHDPRARTYMLLNADCSKYFPIHRYVTGEVNDGPPKPWVYGARQDPQYTLDMVGYPNQNTAIHVDLAHEPQFLFDAIVLMFQEGNTAKANEYLTELKYWVSWNFYNGPVQARGVTKGIFNPNASANQPRGAAWGFRDVLMLCFICQHYAPDDTWYPWAKTCVEENVKFFNGVFNVGDYDTSAMTPYYDKPLGAFQNVIGITQSANFGYGGGYLGGPAVIAPWMQGFLGSVFIWGYLLDLDISPAAKTTYRDLAHFMARFVVMMFGAPRIAGNTASWDYRRCGQYNLNAGITPLTARDPYADVAFHANASELWNANVGVFFADSLPNTDDHDIRDGENSSFLATRYDDNLVPHLTMAVELGAYGANEAFNRFRNSRQFGSGGSVPFAYLPKGYRYGTAGADLPPSSGPAPTLLPRPR